MPDECEADDSGRHAGDGSRMESALMRAILTDHAHRYPQWAIDDLFKLMHQAAMGAEHALANEAAAREWLTRELAGLGRGPDEPLVDSISPDGRIARIHLRPFVERRLRPESLLQAFVRTAREAAPSPGRLERFAAVAARLAEEGMIRFGRDEIAARLAELRNTGFPAVHHSPGFVEMYRPAYRVVAREFLPGEIAAAGKVATQAGSAQAGGE